MTEYPYADEVPCPDGPLLVRGMGREITDGEGTVHRTSRPVSAVCRCDKSALRPWCDGTHKLLAPAAAASAESGSSRSR